MLFRDSNLIDLIDQSELIIPKKGGSESGSEISWIQSASSSKRLLQINKYKEINKHFDSFIVSSWVFRNLVMRHLLLLVKFLLHAYNNPQARL